MDYLLIFYSLILGLLFVSPFFYLKIRETELKNSFTNDQSHFLKERRKNLLENLKDLKFERQTGKSTEEEFDEISTDIIFELKKLDEEIDSQNQLKINPEKKHENLFCQTCSLKIPLLTAKFCPNCGKELK